MKTTREKAFEIAQLLEDGKGRDITIIEVSALNSWTDFFVIATVTSSAHWQGLHRQVTEYAYDNDMQVHQTNRRHPDSGDDWNLIDLGAVVVHLMSRDARGFYALEELWQGGIRLR